jgi:hypothetical protein
LWQKQTEQDKIMLETQELTLDVSQNIEIHAAVGDAYKALNSSPD